MAEFLFLIIRPNFCCVFFVWVFWFTAHHTAAVGCGCVFWLQRFCASVSMWAVRFSPQEQHTSMYKQTGCENETCIDRIFPPQETNITSSTQTRCTKLKRHRLCFGCAQLSPIADKREQGFLAKIADFLDYLTGGICVNYITQKPPIPYLRIRARKSSQANAGRSSKTGNSQATNQTNQPIAATIACYLKEK